MSCRLFPAVALAVLAAFLIAADPEPTSCPAPVLDEFRADPKAFFFLERDGEAIACGQTVLTDEGLGGEMRREVLTTLGCMYVARGNADGARKSFLAMLAEDPTMDLPYSAWMPERPMQVFYALRDSLMTASALSVEPDVRTLAIGDIENNSIFADPTYDLDQFVNGLRHILTTDLVGATPLRLVDRQRLDVLRQEIGLNRDDDIVNPEMRVPFGKLTGAQSFLFGSLMRLDDDLVRLDLRWVNTATGEILLAEGVEGGFRSAKDLLKLEREVLTELLVPQIRATLDDADDTESMDEDIEVLLKRRREGLSDPDEYVRLVLRTGEAILAEERGDLDTASRAWGTVVALDPSDDYARNRQASLRAYDNMSG